MSVSERVRPLLSARAATDPNAASLLEIFVFGTTAQRIVTFLPQEEFAGRIGISQN